MADGGGSGGIGILGVLIGAAIVIGIGFLLIGNPIGQSKSTNIKIEMPKVSTGK